MLDRTSWISCLRISELLSLKVSGRHSIYPVGTVKSAPKYLQAMTSVSLPLSPCPSFPAWVTWASSPGSLLPLQSVLCIVTRTHSPHAHWLPLDEVAGAEGFKWPRPLSSLCSTHTDSNSASSFPCQGFTCTVSSAWEVLLGPFLLGLQTIATCHIQKRSFLVSHLNLGILYFFFTGSSLLWLHWCYVIPTSRLSLPRILNAMKGRDHPCCVLSSWCRAVWPLEMPFTKDSFMKRGWAAPAVFNLFRAFAPRKPDDSSVPSLESGICTHRHRLIPGVDFDHRFRLWRF